MKRKVQFLLTMVLVLVLTACGETANSPQAESTNGTDVRETQTGSEAE